MSLEKILIIEDNEKHIEDARAYFANKDVEVTYASCMDDADFLEPDRERIDALRSRNRELYKQFKEGILTEEQYDVERLLVEEELGSQPKKATFDGIISDVYFPLSGPFGAFSEPEPIGVAVMVEAEQHEIPCVLNTAGYHHGVKYEWVNRLAKSMSWSLIDSGNYDGGEGSVKNWEQAYQALQGRAR